MNIIVATDFSEHSIPALKWGAFLSQQLGSDLTVMHVVDMAAGDNTWRILVETPEEIEQSAVVEANKKLRDFVGEHCDVDESEVNFRCCLGTPIDEILAEAEGKDDPVIVAGTRGASRFKEFVLGNTARRLVRQSDEPVVVVPPEAEVEEPKDLVVGVDFSDPSREAIRRAAAMARTYGAKLHLVYGYVLPEVATLDGSMGSISTEIDEVVANKKQNIQELVQELGAEDVVEDVDCVHLSPAQAIRQWADEHDAQWIFMGSHGRRGIKRFFLGNTAERVMRKAPCPIFVVRPGQLDDTREKLKGGGGEDEA